MFNFNDKVVLITGASGNLGQAVAGAFRGAGARLALADRAPEAADDAHPRAMAVAVDLLEAASVQAMVTTVLDRFGRIDILCNIAGGYRAGQPVHETEDATWDLMLNLNARAIVYTARAVVPHMVAQGHGKIVNVGSAGAEQGTRNHGAYAASKSAVLRLTESMSAELRRRGVNVNAVMPGTMDTPQNRSAMPNAKHERWVAPADVASVILFLASNAASAVHGASVPVVGLS